jgi:hypothetical protein
MVLVIDDEKYAIGDRARHREWVKAKVYSVPPPPAASNRQKGFLVDCGTTSASDREATIRKLGSLSG